MATPTSSSNRSKRKGTKPITQGQNPQRANRQKVSNANVTNAGQRTNTGSAKVTRGATPKPADPWKAPAPKNSRTSAPTSNTQFRTGNKPITLPNSRAQGTNLPRQGAQQLRNTTQGPRASSTPSAKPSGSFKAPSIPKPSALKAATKASGVVSKAGKLAGAAGKALGAVGVVGAMASEVKAMSDRNKTFSWNRPKVKPDANGRSSRGVRVSDKSNKRDYQAAPTGSQRYNDYRNQQIAAERERLKGVGNPPSKPPKPPAPTQDRGGSTQDRGANNSPRRQPPAAAPAKPFGGTVSEGRRIWAEKYSSSKYDGQAIQKEAQAVLKKLKEEKNNQSNAQRAGWDGNKNY